MTGRERQRLRSGWARRGSLLPEVRRVSGGELWRIIEALGVGYVTLNPPSAGQRTKTFRLRSSAAFQQA